MRQCTPAYDAETMAMAAGTPRNYDQQHLVIRSKNKRLPPTSGPEAIADGRMLPKGPQGESGDANEYAPSDGPGPDEAGSDPPTSQEDRSERDVDEDDAEDPGEGQRGRIRNRSDRSTSSEEMTAGEDQPTAHTKRNLEGQVEESETVRQRIDEGTTETEERPDKFLAVRVEYVRSVNEIESFMRKELPRYHIDEEVELDELDELETAVGSENDDGSGFISEEEDEAPNDIPKWSHDVEEGPPKLDEKELEKVDGVSRQKEIERLTEMKVLKEMPEGADVSKFLSTKVVYDWRHREGEWRRRGRLVAREFRWLSSYDIASLFSPTGVASTVKLLSGLFVSSKRYTLGNIDVGDTYLMVEQDEPTVVEVDGRYYQLGFTLPGQRIGSSAWFGKLKGYLEEFGLKSDDGLPALFFKRPENGKQGMIVLSHVDDMELSASKEEFHRLVEFLKGKGLKVKVEGPMNEIEGSMSFLKRGFHATSEGNVEITMNSKYIEGLVEVLELEKAYTKKIPCPADNGRAFQAQKGGQDPLTAELHHVYRKGVGIPLYLAPERPDVMYVLKKLSTKLASPTNSDLEMLRHVAKYLKGTPDITLVHRKSYPGKSFRHAQESEETERNPYEQESLIEVISDSDWAADRESRQSVSCGAIMLNGNLIHFQSKRQKCVSLSSCEAETVAATSILSEAVFLRSLLTRILGKEPKMVLYSDSSSSRQLIARKGLGKARHLDVDLLWIQRIEDLKIKPIKGKDNPADLGTKSLTRDKIRKYMVTIGYVGDYLDEGEAVDTGEAEVRIVQRTGRFEDGRLQRIIQAVTMAVLVGLGEAYEERREGSSDEDQTAGLSMCTIAMAGLLFMCICRKVITAAVLLKGRLRAKAKRRRKEREEKMSATREVVR